MYPSSRLPVAFASLFALVGCSATPDPEDTAPADTQGPAPTEGAASLRFGIDEDYAAEMTEAPNGTFYGAFYHEADVTELGPTEEAVPIETFRVDLALAVDGTLTEILYTSGALPIGKVYVLGYLDSDQNGVGTGPDTGDPVTRPGFDHRLEVIGGQTTLADVVLDFLMS